MRLYFPNIVRLYFPIFITGATVVFKSGDGGTTYLRLSDVLVATINKIHVCFVLHCNITIIRVYMV